MIIDNYKYFKGEHCETTAVGNLLNNKGIELSEAMLFGIGEGLSFIYWDSKKMGFPFLGGRCKPDNLTENIVKNLKLHMEVNETSSISKAWENERQEDLQKASKVLLDISRLEEEAMRALREKISLDKKLGK